METLLTAIAVWLSANFSIPTNFDNPRIEYVPQAKMIEMRVHAMHNVTKSAGQIPNVAAIYDDERRTIFLLKDGLQQRQLTFHC